MKETNREKIEKEIHEDSRKIVNIDQKAGLKAMNMVVIDCNGIMFWCGLVIEIE
jgi:hypothetical protein